MYIVRKEINVLLTERRKFESCDENAATKHCQCRYELVAYQTRQTAALSLRWRQPLTIMELNPEETRLLVAAGYDLKITDHEPYIHTMETRWRHRYLVWTPNGFVFSTEDKAKNVEELVASPDLQIAGLELSPREIVVRDLHDAYRNLRSDLRLHGVLANFHPQQEKIWAILVDLFRFACRELRIPDNVEKPIGLGKLVTSA
jgi:hypothetical protein